MQRVMPSYRGDHLRNTALFNATCATSGPSGLMRTGTRRRQAVPHAPTTRMCTAGECADGVLAPSTEAWCVPPFGACSEFDDKFIEDWLIVKHKPVYTPVRRSVRACAHERAANEKSESGRGSNVRACALSAE